METVDDLKNDIIRKETIVKQEQCKFKKFIDDGLFDNADEILSNEYYFKTLQEIEKDKNIEREHNVIEPLKRKDKKSLLSIMKKNLKKIVFNN